MPKCLPTSTKYVRFGVTRDNEVPFVAPFRLANLEVGRLAANQQAAVANLDRGPLG